MYRTYDCQRIGVFHIKEACKSMDISKDSKWLLAAGTTNGALIFSIEKGTLEAHVKIPSQSTLFFKYVEFNMGDTKYLLVHDKAKRSHIQIFDFKKAFEKDGEKHEVEILGPQDHLVTQASWGFLNKTIYLATDKGKFIVHDLETQDTKIEKDIHRLEIFSFAFTYDQTMLITCSRDGTAKLLNRNTLEVFREFKFGKPCRSASISPLFDNEECQKFHVLLAGGQDAKDVTTTEASAGGFGIQLMSIIFNESLSEITGHFGTVHTLAYSPDGTSFASGSEDGYVHYHKFPPEYFTKKFE